MKKALLLIFSCFVFFSAEAQFGTAPDFTVEDINGNTHNLYDILDSGKIVIVDVSATWCGPCWSNHQAHILEDVYLKYGPEAMNLVEVIFYEGDPATTQADLEGTGGNTLGDWIAGTTYPIVNETPLQLDLSIYAPQGFPTVNVIRPSDREIVADAWNINAEAIGVILDELIAAEGLTSTEQEVLGQQINLAPNPSSQYINLNTALDIQKIDVIDATGQWIKSIDNDVNTIDVSSFEAGLYFLNIHTANDRIAVKKFNKVD